MRIAGFSMRIGATETDVQTSGLTHGISALFDEDRASCRAVHSELAEALYGSASDGFTATGRVQLALLPGEHASENRNAWPLALRLQGLSTADMPILSRWLAVDFTMNRAAAPLVLGPSWESDHAWRAGEDRTAHRDTALHSAARCEHTSQHESTGLPANTPEFQQAIDVLDDCQQRVRQRISDQPTSIHAHVNGLTAERQCLSALAARIADMRSGLSHHAHGQCPACLSEQSLGQMQVVADSLSQRLESVNAMLSAQQQWMLDREARAELEELTRCRAALDRYRGWMSGQGDVAQPTSTRHETPLATASRIVHRLTQGAIVGITRNDASSHAEVILNSRSRCNFETLAAEQRDLVEISLCLAAATLYQESGLSLPLILGEPMARLDGQQRHVLIETLQDFAGDDAQIVVLTSYQQLAEQLRARRLRTIRHETQYVAPARTVPIQQPPIQQPPIQPEPVGSRPVRRQKFHVQVDSPIERLEFLRPSQLAGLKHLGIDFVSDLLDSEPETLSRELVDVHRDSIVVWQQAAVLACFVPELDSHDGFVLASGGVDDPESLANCDEQRLYRRIRSFLRHEAEGRRYRRRASRYNRERLSGWKRSARKHAAGWRNSGYYKQRQATTDRKISSRPTTQSAPRPKLHQRPQPLRATSQPTKKKTTRPVAAKSTSNASPRFYLDGTDAVVDAPTIGPKMAERLEKIGIVTVADLLTAKPDEVAKKLKLRNTKSDTVLEWQRQSRLMTQVPGLRGHDASILVACDFITPQSVAAQQPADLLAVVLPFCETKEGKRILRGGQLPDLAEVTDWVSWAQLTLRSDAA